jgi:hypothetical protein
MNDTPPRRRLWPTIGYSVILAAALAGCLLLAGYLYLPVLVTHRLPVAYFKRLGVSDFTGRISRIGLGRTTAGPLAFGPADHPALAIGAITIDYTLGDLRRKKIDRVRIRDVVVNASLGPGGISFPGLDSGALAKNGTAAAAPSVEPSALAPITLGKLEIRSGLVNLTWRKTTYKIPFEADVTSDGKDVTTLGARVRLFPRDQRLVVAVRVDMKKGEGRVSIDGHEVDLNRFADLIDLFPGLDATGNVSVQASVRVTSTPVVANDAAIDLAWHRGGVAYDSVLIEPGPEGGPAVLTAQSGDLKTWQIKAGGMQLQAPVPVAVSKLAATVHLGSGMQTVAGDAELRVLPFSLERSTPVALSVGTFLPVTFDGTRNASGGWTAACSVPEMSRHMTLGPVDLSIAGVGIHTPLPRFSLTATGDGRNGVADWQLDLNPTRATAFGAAVNLPSVHATGQLQLQADPHVAVWRSDARIQVPGPTFEGNGMTGKLDALSVSARLQQQGSDPPAVDARIQFSNGRFHHPDSGLLLSGGSLDLPYHSNPSKTVRQGAFSIDRIVQGKRACGKIQGHVTQEKEGYAFSATHVSDLLPGMTAVLAGTVRPSGAGFPHADLAFQIPSYALPVDSDLGSWVPSMTGVALSGTVSARGKATLNHQGVNGSLSLGMAGGALRMADRKLVVEGIDTTLWFPELPRIRSGPAQSIRFGRATLGGIVVDGGTFDIQVESKNTLFIEKGHLLWCGGKVDSGSLRITAGKQDYNMTLYCQRLGLSRILEQLGSVNARGTGTVNGRIPIAYSSGVIRFDDGFLFSTPGETGRIQLSGTEVLTRGIPAGTPQFAQVDLAREALKDYAYSWAKLGLASEGEDFVMRLQFDGKPANPLPFIYKKEIGSFIRVEAGAQGSIFQGIGLDVNLRLPLNQLLQYKDIVNMIQ